MPSAKVWHDRARVIFVGGQRDNFRMRQLQFFTSAELARMRDRTAAAVFDAEIEAAQEPGVLALLVA
jgi:hypothetical protein